MGSFAYVDIAGYPILETKNSYDEDLVKLIFRPEEFIRETRLNHSRNEIFWGDGYKGDKGKYEFYGFKQKADICLQRLKIYGTTLTKVKADFKKAKKLAVEERFYSFAISKITFAQYENEVKYILKNKIKSHENLLTNLRDSLVTLDLSIYGMPYASYLYSILKILGPDDYIEYDLTDIVRGGWVKIKDVTNIEIDKIIVLTEGKTDTEFISKSLEILFPHLKPYYHFINFEDFNVESNASVLVKLVIAFAAAGIKHPIIVLFDNDTTGLMEMKKLASLKLGDNFKIMHLPDIDLARKYPTIGPAGLKNMNVNGFAGGIEMYFGDEILSENGKLTPVHWKGYNDREEKYQGEISNKKEIQNRFREKIKSKSTGNMKDMNLLLYRIFSSFNDKINKSQNNRLITREF